MDNNLRNQGDRFIDYFQVDSNNQLNCVVPLNVDTINCDTINATNENIINKNDYDITGYLRATGDITANYGESNQVSLTDVGSEVNNLVSQVSSFSTSISTLESQITNKYDKTGGTISGTVLINNGSFAIRDNANDMVRFIPNENLFDIQGELGTQSLRTGTLNVTGNSNLNDVQCNDIFANSVSTNELLVNDGGSDIPIYQNGALNFHNLDITGGSFNQLTVSNNYGDFTIGNASDGMSYLGPLNCGNLNSSGYVNAPYLNAITNVSTLSLNVNGMGTIGLLSASAGSVSGAFTCDTLQVNTSSVLGSASCTDINSSNCTSLNTLQTTVNDIKQHTEQFTIFKNIRYVNIGATEENAYSTLQAALVGLSGTVQDTIKISDGSYSSISQTINIDGVNNLNICGQYAPVDGSNVLIYDNVQIGNTTDVTRIRFSNINFYGSVTVNTTSGRILFDRCVFNGAVNVIRAGSNWVSFTDCNFNGLVFDEVFGGVCFLIRCNFNGINPTFNQASGLQVQSADCLNWQSFPSASQATLGGNQVLFTGTTRFNANELFAGGNAVSTYTPSGTSTQFIRGDGSYTLIQQQDIPSSIDALKIGNGVVSNIEFSYLDGVTSNVQNQLNTMVKRDGSVAMIGDLNFNNLYHPSNLSEPTNSGDATRKSYVDGLISNITNSIGASGGICPLDVNSKVDTSYLPEAVLGSLNYKGLYSVVTNTPTLADTDIDKKGYFYVLSDSGSRNFGAGSITFTQGDWVLNDGTVWSKVDAVDQVSSVFGRTGVITANDGDYNAGQVVLTPFGEITSNRVQAGIEEVVAKTQPINSILTGISNSSNLLAERYLKYEGNDAYTWSEVSSGSSSPFKALIRANFSSNNFVSGVVERYDGGTALTLVNSSSPSSTQVGAFYQNSTGFFAIKDGSGGLWTPTDPIPNLDPRVIFCNGYSNINYYFLYQGVSSQITLITQINGTPSNWPVLQIRIYVLN